MSFSRPRANRRLNSVQNTDRLSSNLSRHSSRVRVVKAAVSYSDAYTFALRAAYLHHLLQIRPKKKQYVPAPKPTRRVTAVAIGDMVQDFAKSSSTKTKFPHGFMGPLEKRMQGVVVGQEKLREYKDAAVRRTFAEAYQAFSDPSFRKRMDKERRVEDLVLIFYSKSTKANQQGTAPDDDSWRPMVDRHVALFVRMFSQLLKDQGSDKDRPELMTRLATLEKGLLTNAQDLTADTGEGPSGTYIEVTTPLSYDIKDMPMVQVVARIFDLTNTQVQSDIDAHKTIWTEAAALADLKAYQHCLDLNTKRTLRSDDFDIEEGYHDWKRSEGPELSKMMAEILQARPDLMKSVPGSNKPLPAVHSNYNPEQDQAYSDIGKSIAAPLGDDQFYSFDQPVDMSSLSLDENQAGRLYLEESTYVFIPPDPRSFYKFIVAHAMTFDQLHPSQTSDDPASVELLSRQSLELLTELCVRWRIPQFSRLVLFLDVAAQKFLDQVIDLDGLDAAFEFVKNPPTEKKRGHTRTHSMSLESFDQSHWTIHDFALYRQVLTNLNDALLRDLYDILQHCYETKPPSPGPVLTVLESHIHNDPSLSFGPDELEIYKAQLKEGLASKAVEVYRGYLEAEVPHVQEEWQFFHVIQLGKAVVKLCERIQKRYRKSPELMGVNPLTILVETMFPSFENDANDLILRILRVAQENEVEVDLQDGFMLYKELVEIRRIHQAALPDRPFAFRIEEVLAEFVWRWIAVAEEKMDGLIDESIKQDTFQIQSENPNNPADDERHSTSIVDIFRLFNQTADEIFRLEWDDDVQYAKFMTAMSRSFGLGLARYCEVLEKQFSKEMNRLSPSQEAALNQSKQEKWMQLAKDAWVNKEKIEPFQFYPESFVKLNNIEYAIQQLDILEKTMNVDACAEVLKKNAPPREKQKRPTKYVFTVKIVEGEDLRACDPSGLSDPYVVLGDEVQKRLFKTRTIMRNLNPRWEESIDISVNSPMNIIATIWDWDMIGDHDYVGRTSLKLDPAHFSDYMPREYWLNLDTQGKLLLRVSMEGERDDIQFYFGKAFRLLKRTERDMTRKITDKLSQYINSALSQDALRYLLSRGISSTVTSLFRNRQSIAPTLTQADIESALNPLFTYFDDNFAIMKQTLTDASMVMVMTRLWKEVLLAIEGLLVPPLSDKPSSQRPLTQQEMDVTFKWLELLFNFFHAKDEQTGEVLGVPADVLKSPKYHELATLNFFYLDTTDNLIRTSERMASATAQRAQVQANQNRLSAPANLGAQFGNFIGSTSVRRTKSIMLSRNLGTMRKAKEEKRKEAQADPNDDMILRILRMRPEAANYLRDRNRQKERLAAAAAAEQIVRQSINSGPRFGANNLPLRR